ncbi:iron-containing alcohol dehydrogenase family protein [Clostridium ganghwense]|uniref:Iron-containing alcohol dehydrogenase family protein n=1 Tax=Clostridium ganghwense TaxID=312089 RepID=A0ABT4CQY1_9CLOT|nr:iron-containing alcohol dehydrogenase family protein [Clostridium ganghwense]MCY6371439.1 iron-containing alcohol dehydrogenase family protein [Clostridium ganghwense]
MKDFRYFMSTEVFYGKNIINEKADLFTNYGKKAFIITGRNSSKRNGSLDDVINILKEKNIDYCIFNEIEENPSLETVEKAADKGKMEGVDFIIGIGGGSPIDSAKGIGILIKNENASVEDLFSEQKLESIPIIAIPTTAGTGTEVTPYAIFTDHRVKTKRNFSQKIFPKVALLDSKYLMTTPDSVTINTAVDALSHLVEGYLTTKANVLSDAAAEKGVSLFGECMEALKKREFTYEIREKLLLISTLGGIVIAQTGTSLPHGMGYSLTYFKGVPHGKANGLLLKSYLEMCSDKKKVNKILECMKLNNLEELEEFIKAIMDKDILINEEEIDKYSETIINNAAKLKNHPDKVTKKDIVRIYVNRLKK